MISFRRIDKCWQNAKKYTGEDVTFFLEENEWDDYGYKTTYYLHASSKLTGGDPRLLGSLRIMRKDQSKKDIFLLKKIFGDSVFYELPPEFVSLSMDIDLYVALNRYLDNKEDRLAIIKALHLILGKDSDYYDESLEDDDCFNLSLLRDDSSLESFALQKGFALLYSSECFYDLRKESVTVKFEHVSNAIDLHFTCVEGDDDRRLPNGIVVFVGKNGSGKSTAIYRLAKLMYTDPTNRFRLKKDVGELIPNNIGVSKMLLISYSPFDNFIFPTSYSKDYMKLIKDGEDVISRFVFCGIRDIYSEEIEGVKIEESIDEKSDEIILKKIIEDRKSKTSLKDISVLADEFVTAFNTIRSGFDSISIWSRFLERSKVSQPSLYEDIKDFGHGTSNSELKAKFMSFSTGHKFLIHTYVRLLAYLEDNCLILFDEPENHLHPPLISFMITEIRALLSVYHSVMFIATHSPVILQETFARNVFIVRKNGNSTSITQPQIETYGASISEITSEVFDLTTDVTQYLDAIEHLYDRWLMEYEPSVEQMLSSFEEKLGHKLTGQVESYLINLYERDNYVED